MKNATTFIVGFRYHASLKKLVIFSFFLDYHFMFLFPRYNEDVIKTTRFVDSNPPRWPDFFTLAYTLYPKNVTRPKGKKLSVEIISHLFDEFIELDPCIYVLGYQKNSSDEA